MPVPAATSTTRRGWSPSSQRTASTGYPGRARSYSSAADPNASRCSLDVMSIAPWRAARERGELQLAPVRARGDAGDALEQPAERRDILVPDRVADLVDRVG